MKVRVILIVLLFSVAKLYSQHSQPSVLHAYRLHSKIKFDGILDDPVWKKAQRVSNFTQRELDYGKPVTERTEVAVAYNRHGLYFGIWCYMKNAKKIVAKSLNVDFDYDDEDNFQIMLSPFDDNRTGYLFVINPYGARADLQIYGMEDVNEDWNGVWDAKTSITDSGWFAEVYIPFNTLQFKRDSQMVWGLNFERDIASENEQALWQGWSRDRNIFSVVDAGKLVGLRNISYVHRFEFKPYLLVGRQYQKGEGVSYPVRSGADLNVYLTPSLKMNLTTFTDFAQVEVDRIPVNLSRFSVYYPEKRQFFLSGSNYFSFYLGARSQVFYSRQIGIENHQQVPILAGVRIYGRVKHSDIGFLSMQEKAIDTIPSTNNTVFRYKYEIGKQSYVGGIFTDRLNKNGSNQVYGFDAQYRTAQFLHNKNLTICGRVAMSTENFKPQKNNLAYLFFVDYPNDFIDNFIGFGQMQENFDAQLGYIYRKNYDFYAWHLHIMPRVFTKYGIKKLIFKPWSFILYRTHSTGKLESFYNEIRPLGAIFETGDRFEFNLQQNFDRIDEPFHLTNSITIPVGKYWMFRKEIQIETYHGRRIWVFFNYNWGGYYDGRIHTIETNIGININKNLNLSENYTYNRVEFDDGQKLITHELASYINLAFTTKLNVSAFIQYNSLDNIFIYNIRLHWIPKIGSDFYLVWTTGYDQPLRQIHLTEPVQNTFVGKLVYRITF